MLIAGGDPKLAFQLADESGESERVVDAGSRRHRRASQASGS